MRTLFNQNAPEQATLNLSAAPRERQFTDKYEPAWFDEVCGQEPIISTLREFVANPYSTAFLFHGRTGTGKTSTAKALAAELGCDFAANFYHVLSGTADGDLVESIVNAFRLTPWGPAGSWRVVLVDEADQCTPKAKQLWLSTLERLPAHTVIIFTTNHLEKFEQRTLDRFQHEGFCFRDSNLEAAQAYADRIWSQETGGEDGPSIDQLPNVVINGEISYRRVAMAVQAAVRDGVISARASEPPSPVFLEPSRAEANPGQAVSVLCEEPNADRSGQAGPAAVPPDDRDESATIRDRVPQLPCDRAATEPAGMGHLGMEQSSRDAYADGRTIPIVGDDVHCTIGDGWRIVGRVVDRQGEAWVRLETGDLLPIDEDWSVIGDPARMGSDQGSCDPLAASHAQALDGEPACPIASLPSSSSTATSQTFPAIVPVTMAQYGQRGSTSKVCLDGPRSKSQTNGEGLAKRPISHTDTAESSCGGTGNTSGNSSIGLSSNPSLGHALPEWNAATSQTEIHPTIASPISLGEPTRRTWPTSCSTGLENAAFNANGQSSRLPKSNESADSIPGSRISNLPTSSEYAKRPSENSLCERHGNTSPNALTPFPVFLAPIAGGAPEPIPGLVIKGTAYDVERIGANHYRLSKEGSDSVYDVEWTAAKGAVCNCLDFQRRHADLEGQSEGCKHIRACRSAKLLPALASVSAVRPAPTPVAAPIEPDPAPISQELTDQLVAINQQTAERIAADVGAGTETIRLADFVEREAAKYESTDSAACELIAQTLRHLATDIRAMGADNVADYEARKELQERWLAESR